MLPDSKGVIPLAMAHCLMEALTGMGFSGASRTTAVPYGRWMAYSRIRFRAIQGVIPRLRTGVRYIEPAATAANKLAGGVLSADACPTTFRLTTSHLLTGGSHHGISPRRVGRPIPAPFIVFSGGQRMVGSRNLPGSLGSRRSNRVSLWREPGRVWLHPGQFHRMAAEP